MLGFHQISHKEIQEKIDAISETMDITNLFRTPALAIKVQESVQVSQLDVDVNRTEREHRGSI